MTVEEVAEALRISRNTCYDLVAMGELRRLNIGRRILVPKQAVAEMVMSKPGQGSSAARTDTSVSDTKALRPVIKGVESEKKEPRPPSSRSAASRHVKVSMAPEKPARTASPGSHNPGMMTVREAAAALRIGPEAVRDEIRAGRIKEFQYHG